MKLSKFDRLIRFIKAERRRLKELVDCTLTPSDMRIQYESQIELLDKILSKVDK